MEVVALSEEQYEHTLNELTTIPPIEQTRVWQDYEQTVPGRTFWGYVGFKDGGNTVAVAAFQTYETHGYHFLHGHHAPVWAAEPTAEQETAALEALARYVHSRDRRQVFIRLSVAHELPITRPCLSTVPYDSTVIIDLSGGDEEILSRMKPRGRRDVRKALRESPVECADETDKAIASFDEYYDVMVETGARDGFTPAPIDTYESMVSLLGRDHCRVFAGREDGRVVTWSIVTLSGTRATRYYAASRSETMRKHVTDKLVYFECCELARQGIHDYDLMGVGSDFAPSLMGLNEFKTKFTKEGIRSVAPNRDLPIRTTLYRTLTGVRNMRNRLRDGNADSDKDKKNADKKNAEQKN